ncbi:D-alanyl-D-alanine carboxypeptidase/D-alanyl-D-alanine endopeptidase [Undibacterium sp.]|jgi:D-alanyl-D-alanine carboxypeptidase/D-alanyl-D-alanine-endopeptidase (penicillin-binding protein 4)|uniref:D-alanyl-D-alanine carboxypeptidase/D-alanyl-D-alanine endopeptidase n=1 Tax=Undibacterium sp. TaxID=1914977 RepID=UPI002CFB6310|nr:D-alanyl-D-alanine carboxypeptidase/D-alanyl-D-alanine-endopeptidase [Undibacterium sp.]HTD06400.1 D-alanyl-D-alanine carboxypeptidase/D-alanyl-D-alanine-endopeptidase [Undibacterium sp.]
MRRLISLVLLFCAAQSLHAQSVLPANVSEALVKANLPAQALSAWVAPVSAGFASPTLSVLADRAMSPASTMKLVTTMIALDELGPTYRWKTAMLSDATIRNDTLRGTLYLRGGGDPNLSWDKLELMLRSLRAQGIRKISGNIVLDRSFFQPARLDVNAPPFDDTPDAYYNVIPDALLVHSNLITFSLESSANRIAVHTSPPMSKVGIENHLMLDDRNCAEWEAGWKAHAVEVTRSKSANIVLSGSFPRNCKAATELNTLERNLYIERVIQALWREIGGSWSGTVQDGVTPPNAKLLVERQSETLADTIRIVNKRSDNTMARLLYLTLGAERAKTGNYQSTLQAANDSIIAWFNHHGIDANGMVLENGSGLSRLERISPAQLAALLKVAAHSNWFAEYASSMPIVAVDGTMRKRLKGTAAEGRARIKTGTLKNTVAVAGYVRDSYDENWIVVAMINNDDVSKGRIVLDELLVWVANGGAEGASKLAQQPPPRNP